MNVPNSKSEHSDKEQEAEAIFEVVLRGEKRRRAKRSAIFAIVFAALGMFFYICSFKAWFSLKILFRYASILFWILTVIFGIKSSVILFASREPGLSKRFYSTAIKVFLLGVFLFALAICSLFRPLFYASFVLVFLIGPALGIIGIIVSFRDKTLLGRFFAIVLFFILIIPLLMGCRNILVWSLPHIYTPPALTLGNLKVYNECIGFVRKHDEYKNLRLWRGVLSNGYDTLVTKKSFSKNDILETSRLYNRLYRVRCVKLQRDNDMLLFYKLANSSSLLDPSWPYFLPVGAGALYSLSGKNPNEIDSEFLNAGKPFIRIDGDWYMSNHLMLTGPRMDIQTSIPNPVFDHSLRTKGFNLSNRRDKK
jgi:hypothetical protein